MKKHLSGSCLCGTISFAVSGDLDDFLLCHCSRCRKSSGSAHTSNILIKSAVLNWTGNESVIKSFILTGTNFARCFCGECGSALPAFEDDVLVVPAGAIDGDLEIKPSAHIFAGSRAIWDDHLENLKYYNELPIKI